MFIVVLKYIHNLDLVLWVLIPVEYFFLPKWPQDVRVTKSRSLRQEHKIPLSVKSVYEVLKIDKLHVRARTLFSRIAYEGGSERARVAIKSDGLRVVRPPSSGFHSLLPLRHLGLSELSYTMSGNLAAPSKSPRTRGVSAMVSHFQLNSVHLWDTYDLTQRTI